MNTLAYEIGKNLYLNVTNQCTNKCGFCVRNKPGLFNNQYTLWLEHDPSAQEVLVAIYAPWKYEEIVFCGYGEPLIRLDVVKVVAGELKKLGCKVRIDTNGQASLYHKRDIVPELAGLVDIVSISLNAHTAALYQKMCVSDYGEKGFTAMLDFASRCVKLLPKVYLTVVDMPGADIPACSKIATDIGAELKVRKYYESEYNGFN